MIRLISCQPLCKLCGSENLDDYKKFERENVNTKYLIFPEKNGRNIHPVVLYNSMKELFKEYLTESSGMDLIVVSHQDVTMNALRISALECNSTEKVVFTQIDSNGLPYDSKIDEKGGLDFWMEDVWDTWETALTSILDYRSGTKR